MGNHTISPYDRYTPTITITNLGTITNFTRVDITY